MWPFSYEARVTEPGGAITFVGNAQQAKELLKDRCSTAVVSNKLMEFVIHNAGWEYSDILKVQSLPVSVSISFKVLKVPAACFAQSTVFDRIVGVLCTVARIPRGGPGRGREQQHGHPGHGHHTVPREQGLPRGPPQVRDGSMPSLHGNYQRTWIIFGS